MSKITTQHIVVAGTPPQFLPAAAGDTAAVSDRNFLVVKNTNLTPITTTIAVPGTLPNGVAAPDTAVTVASSDQAWVPLDIYYADPTDRLAHISYSTTVGVSRAVMQR